MSTEAEPVAQTHPFQAEVAELLRLMVHSVYSEADIFLRELISNASDACDKLRYEAIAKPELLADGRALAIRIKPDAAAGILTVEDTGIGMDRAELIDNLGTVARSGTRAFIERLAQANDGAGLIGQFGVGFYSAFMVADRIEVTSARAGSPDTIAASRQAASAIIFSAAPRASASVAARAISISGAPAGQGGHAPCRDSPRESKGLAQPLARPGVGRGCGIGRVGRDAATLAHSRTEPF